MYNLGKLPVAMKRLKASSNYRTYVNKNIGRSFLESWNDVIKALENMDKRPYNPNLPMWLEKSLRVPAFNKFAEFIEDFITLNDSVDSLKKEFIGLEIVMIGTSYLKIFELVLVGYEANRSYKEIGLSDVVLRRLVSMMQVADNGVPVELTKSPKAGDLSFIEVGLRRILSAEVGYDV